MSYFYAFLSRYKHILILKIKNKEQFNRNNILKEVAKATVFILVIAITIGYFIKTLENLNYVFYIINTTILGSFVLYRSIEEIQYRKLSNVEYKISDAITIDIVSIVSILAISNTLFFTIYFQLLISAFEFIFLGIIIIITQLILYKADDVLGKYVGEKRLLTKVIYTSLWVVLLLIVIMILLPIQVLSFSYLVAVLLVALLYIFKINLIYPRDKYDNYENYFQKIIFFMILLIFAVSFRNNVDEEENVVIFDNLIIDTVPNFYKTIETCDGASIQEVYSNSEYIYLKTSDSLYIYDHNFNKISVINNTFLLGELYIFDDVLYYLKTNESITYNTSNKTLYSLNSQFEFEYILSSDLYDGYYLFKLDEDRYFYNFYRTSYIDVINVEGEDEALSPLEREIIKTDNYIVVNEVDDYRIYDSSYIANGFIYSNKYMASNQDDSIYIVDIDSYLDSDSQALIDLDSSKLNDFTTNYLRSFHVKNDKIYVLSDNNIMNVFSLNSFKLIEKVNVSENSFYMSSDVHFAYDGSEVYLFGKTLSNTVVLKQENPLVLSSSVLVIALFLYIEPKNIMFGERGKKYD